MRSKRVRVLIVDDSAFMRVSLRRMLEGDGRVEPVGTASDGLEAIEKARELQPDVITLDVEMPHMNGIEALKALVDGPWRVLMLSSYTTEGAKTTLDALSLGAEDYFEKPDLRTLAASGGKLADKIVAVSGFSKPLSPNTTLSSPPAPVRTAVPELSGVSVLFVGASTGGPKSIMHIASCLREPPPVPVVVVQHMMEGFTSAFADYLCTRSPVHFSEARNGSPLVPGEVLVAPGGKNISFVLTDGTYRAVVEEAGDDGYRPSIDRALESMAAVVREGLLAVILTGMGTDALAGARAVRAAGGTVVVQDEASSVIWSMPGSIANAGLAHYVMDIADIARLVAGGLG